MDIVLLQRVKTHILEEPARLAMSNWRQKKSDIQPKVIEHYTNLKSPEGYGNKTYHDFPRCGTACCIGGWSVILSCMQYATPSEALQLTTQQQSKLFFVSGWDEPYKTEYMRAGTPEERAPIAGRYIDYFIEKYGDK